MNNHDPFYQAVLARDSRFDGKFFVAVKTTGVYCRPICPARPKRENVEFFKTAAAAEKAGYRPCLRCRPESAPGSPAWNGTRATVERALKLIAQGALEHHTEETFADRLGMTARHLRRLFEEEFGHTPKQLHDTMRLNFARKLITETDLPMTEIGFAAGFHSLRRFNDAFKQRFHRAPSALRSVRNTNEQVPMVRLSLSYRPPFDWQGLLAYYRRHQIAGVETIERDTYSRVFQLREAQATGWFLARPHRRKPELLLEIIISDTRQLLNVVQRIRRMFDLDADPAVISETFARLRALRSLQGSYAGLRLARGFDPFETATGTILGQVISVSQASRVMSQLVATYGDEIQHPLTGACVRVFPGPRTLAEADLRALKITAQKRASLREFASRVLNGTLLLEGEQNPEDFKRAVRTIHGIGAWSAEYMALRALGDADAFPATDLVLRRFIEANPEIDPDVVRPWRGYFAALLWQRNAHVSHEERHDNYAESQIYRFTRRAAQAGGGRVEPRRGALAQRRAIPRQTGRDA